jgi:hypothetical protein
MRIAIPDGTVLAKLAWIQMQSSELRRRLCLAMCDYGSRHGQGFEEVHGDWWMGFRRFINGQPVDEAQHKTCWGCHESREKAHDHVFSRLAPS